MTSLHRGARGGSRELFRDQPNDNGRVPVPARGPTTGVPGAGVEPARLSARAFKAPAYASSATRAGHRRSRRAREDGTALPVDLAGVQRVRARHLVEEEQAVQV